MLFGVLFHSNSVTVEVKGGVKVYLTLPDGTEEVYILEEGIPDMYIKNVLLGTKYVYWTGHLTVKCQSTGYMAQMIYGYKDNKNTVNGIIWNVNDKVEKKEAKAEKSSGWASRWARATVNAAKSTAKFSTGWIYDYEGEDGWINNLKLPFEPEAVQARFGGVCGEAIYVIPGKLRRKDEPADPNDGERYEIVNARTVHSEECSVYPAPEDLEENSSISIWRPVGEALVSGDMEKADIEKTEVEETQREIRKKRETDFVPKYFAVNSDDGWDFWTITDKKWYESDSSKLFVN